MNEMQQSAFFTEDEIATIKRNLIRIYDHGLRIFQAQDSSDPSAPTPLLLKGDALAMSRRLYVSAMKRMLDSCSNGTFISAGYDGSGRIAMLVMQDERRGDAPVDLETFRTMVQQADMSWLSSHDVLNAQDKLIMERNPKDRELLLAPFAEWNPTSARERAEKAWTREPTTGRGR